MSHLERFFSIGKALGMLLKDQGEIVIHDLKTQRISAIFNNLSKRKVGDDSLLEPLEFYTSLPDVFAPYSKTNWDGRKMKSVSVILRDEQKTPIGLFCINLDISKWEEMGRFIHQWVQTDVAKKMPETLFKNDWREKVHIFIDKYLAEKGLNRKTMDKIEKRDLIHSLHEAGGFENKNAATYIADILEISRATVYNYLRAK